MLGAGPSSGRPMAGGCYTRKIRGIERAWGGNMWFGPGLESSTIEGRRGRDGHQHTHPQGSCEGWLSYALEAGAGGLVMGMINCELDGACRVGVGKM